jgi:hypothetical protein
VAALGVHSEKGVGDNGVRVEELGSEETAVERAAETEVAGARGSGEERRRVGGVAGGEGQVCG